MPRRAKVETLPREVRDELDSRLLASGFGGYEALADWLSTAGYEISKSALHRYGSAMEEDFERTMGEVQRTQRLAQAYAEANPDERTALTGATARIAQESLLRIMMGLRAAEEDPGKLARLMPNITRALADLGRLDISREKWSAEQDIRTAERERAAGAAEQAARTQGVSPDGIAALRAAILCSL